jgi:lipid-binding SYLF domain-containing protein
MRHLFRSWTLRALVAACLLPSGVASADTFDRLDNAAVVLDELLSAPDKGVPAELLSKAACVVVVPGLKKAGLGLGGEYGRGYAVCRVGDAWSAPAAMRMESGSIGFQIGVSEIDVVLLVMNRRGMERLLSSRFTLGGDAAVAAGPIGRSAEAKTDLTMRAEILSYSRSRGVFAGIALEGATLREDTSANRELYGRRTRNRAILSGKVATPEDAAELMVVLKKHGA